MKASRQPVELWDPTLAVLEAASTRDGCPLTVGLEQLRQLVGADRADGGYVSSPASTYQPAKMVVAPDRAPADFELPVSDPLVSAIFTSSRPVVVSDFAADVPDGLCRATMLDIDTRAVIARRMDVEDRVFGLICLDWVGEAHTVDRLLVDLVDVFILSVVAPILVSTAADRSVPEPPGLLSELSEAEVDVVRLAADGLSYREIADALGKSVHTIDHQLLSARRRLGAKNTSQLVQLLAPELAATGE